MTANFSTSLDFDDLSHEECSLLDAVIMRPGFSPYGGTPAFLKNF